MDEEKKIMEKRSSFKGWKERNKGKTQKKRNIIIIAIIISIFSVLAIYSYLNDADNSSSILVKQQNDTPSPTPIKKIKVSSSNNSNNSYSKIINTTDVSKKNIIGKIGVPIISSGLEIIVKSTAPTTLHTSIWISVRNIGDEEKLFKIGPGTVVIDNVGQQYENIRVARSAEIAQTNFSSQAMKEGAVFFERLREGRSLKKLILNVNNEKIEFMINSPSE